MLNFIAHKIEPLCKKSNFIKSIFMKKKFLHKPKRIFDFVLHMGCGLEFPKVRWKSRYVFDGFWIEGMQFSDLSLLPKQSKSDVFSKFHASMFS